ncbi:MAG TPA: alpha/beta hydrolase, partial [Micromonosporaceae bacterium]
MTAASAVAIVIAGLLIAPAPVTAAATQGPPCPAPGPPAPVTKHVTATSRPVVLVHGWTGQPLDSTATKLSAKLGSAITTFTFNYSKWASDWASDAHIAACLADYVNLISTAYRHVGGDGKVILVAHSMGGLAIRYASSPTLAAVPITSDEVPVVISLDTPYLGSSWAGAPPMLKELWQTAVGNSAPNPFGTDAAECLAAHDNGQPLPSQCKGLPPWLPKGTTLYEIGGDIKVSRTLLGVHLYDVDLKDDGVVDTRSSLGYGTSGPTGKATAVTAHKSTLSCTVDSGTIGASVASKFGAVLSSLGLPAEAIGDAAVYLDLRDGKATKATMVYTAAALATAECSHIHIPTDADAIDLVAKDIKTYLAAHPSAPRCLSTAAGKPLLAKLVASEGLDVADVQWIKCDGDWATTEFDVVEPDMPDDPNDDVAAFHFVNGSWRAV